MLRADGAANLVWAATTAVSRLQNGQFYDTNEKLGQHDSDSSSEELVRKLWSGRTVPSVGPRL